MTHFIHRLTTPTPCQIKLIIRPPPTSSRMSQPPVCHFMKKKSFIESELFRCINAQKRMVKVSRYDATSGISPNFSPSFLPLGRNLCKIGVLLPVNLRLIISLLPVLSEKNVLGMQNVCKKLFPMLH